MITRNEDAARTGVAHGVDLRQQCRFVVLTLGAVGWTQAVRVDVVAEKDDRGFLWLLRGFVAQSREDGLGLVQCWQPGVADEKQRRVDVAPRDSERRYGTRAYVRGGQRAARCGDPHEHAGERRLQDHQPIVRTRTHAATVARRRCIAHVGLVVSATARGRPRT